MLDQLERTETDASRRSFRVHTLARFRLTSSTDREIPVRSRKTRALLAYLAVSGGRVPREQAAALLWSDRGEDQARASLRQTLHELRRLGWGVDVPPVSTDSEFITVPQGRITLDLQLAREHAAAGDLAALATFLSEASAGGRLLGDLDGLDPEFDQWLRQLRAREPSETMDKLVAAAAQGVSTGRFREARALLSSIETLESTREDVVRLQLRLDQIANEPESFERRWERLVRTLAAELGTSPSPCTSALYSELRAGWPAAIQLEQGFAGPPPPPAARRRPGRLLSIALPVVAALGISGAYVFQQPAEQVAVAPSSPPVIAVLRFDGVGNGQPFLASGLWDEVRTALARNTGLRLLGQITTEASAKANLSPTEWKERAGADYVLTGTVRAEGAGFALTVDLTRTSDGLLLWRDTFAGPLDRQSMIANAVEGQLRSRLAPGGGRRAEQIATSSTVHALYSEARSLLSGGTYEDHSRARRLLREAVERDPNYAPAWAALAEAAYLVNAGVVDDAVLREEGRAASRRALELAPNLADAQVAAGLVEGLGSATGLARLRRAVQLDRSHVDAWNWLGDALARQNQAGAALAAYDAAVRLDPLFWPALINMAQTAADLRRPDVIDDLIQRARRARAEPDVLASLRAFRALATGDLSGAAHALSRGALDNEGRARPAALMAWVQTLGRLDLLERLHKVVDCPPWYPALLRGRIEPPSFVDGRAVSPAEFWMSFYFSYAASRSLFNLGKTKQLVTLYRAGFTNADRFIAETRRTQQLTGLAPTLAMALKAEGETGEARYLLAAAEREIGDTRGQLKGEAIADLAAIKAAQGEHARALDLIARAVGQGWLPAGRTKPVDLAEEPAFRDLRALKGFQAVRSAILATAARERDELRART